MIKSIKLYATLLFVTLFTFLSSDVSAQTDVYLKVYTKTFQRMNLDLYPFKGNSGKKDAEVFAAIISEVLKNDLWMSGFFKVSLKYGTPATESNSNGAQNALAMLTGEFKLNGSRVSITPQLIDGASGSTILRRDYSGRYDEHRALIHQLADDIVYNLTGEQGIARTKIAFVTENRQGIKEIAVMDYDGKNVKTITSDRSINISPAWSPDGNKVCYTSYRDDNPNLYLVNLRTNTQIRLSAVEGLNSAPAWSQDGKSIALTLSKDGNAEIYLLDVDKKRLKRLTYSGAIDSSPSWSPSNHEIAFTSDRSGSPQVYIMDKDGVNVRRLTYRGSYNDSPNWSPRGDRIAYVSRTESGFDIYTIDVTGENVLRLTDSSGSNEDPSWSPNGFSLIFSSTRNGRKALYSMFWDGSDQKLITDSRVSYSPAWSPLLN